jgi:MutT/NUDIX family protein
MDNLTETKLTSEKIYSGCILDFYRDTVRLPNGGTAPRELSRHVGAVCIVPLLDDGRVIVERQFRYPVNEVITEIPAGKRDSRSEAPEAAARRELREETGLRLTAITHVLPPAACTVGIGDERTVCVFGTAEGTFRPSTDPMEEIESAWYTRAQVRALHETDLFGSWALAYSWMFANGCLPGV